MTVSETQTQITIVPASAEHIPQAVRVLADAFITEGFTVHMFDFATDAQRERFRRAQILFAARKHDSGHPILVAMQGDEPVGIAIVKAPWDTGRSEPWHRQMRNLLPHLPMLLGLLRQVRWRHLPTTLRTMQPPDVLGEGYYTLEALAVAPTHQGMGIGRMLLSAVHDLAESDPRARGVYLYTADERNRIIYERGGYEVIGDVGGDSAFSVYHMALTLREAPTVESELVSSDGIRIVEASPEHLSGAEDVHARAFQNEFSTHLTVDLSTPKSRRRFAAAMALSIRHFYARGDTLLVALAGDRVVGMAVLEGLGSGRRVSRGAYMLSLLRGIPALMGLTMHLRWRNLSAALRALRPPRWLKQDHHLL